MKAGSKDVLVLRAGRASEHYWRDVWHYRELLGFLAWRDIRVRYKQAALGIAWAVIQPAVQTVLLTFVFSNLAKMPAGNLPYPLLVLAGLLPWQLFASSFSSAGSSVVSNAHLISKVYFPRLIIPLSALAVAVVDLGVMLGLVLLLAPIFGIWPTWRLAFLPLFALGGLAIALGVGLWITALTVKYRDFRFITPFLVQVGLFITPVGFRTDAAPDWAGVLALNPLTSVIDGFRWSLLGASAPLQPLSLVVSSAISMIILLTGIWFFRKSESGFADVI